MVKLTILLQIEDLDNTDAFSKIFKQSDDMELHLMLLNENIMEDLETLFEEKQIKISSKEEDIYHIIQKCEGEYVFFTDTSLELNENILESIVKKIREKQTDYVIYKSENDFFKIIKKKYLENYLHDKTDEKTLLKVFINAENVLYIDEESREETSLTRQDNISNTHESTEEGRNINYKIEFLVRELEKSDSYNKIVFSMIQEEFLKILNQECAENTINLLSVKNRKTFERIIICENLEEYNLFNKIIKKRESIHEIIDNEEELKKQNNDIIKFNNKLFSSKSWKLTKFLRIKNKTK